MKKAGFIFGILFSLGLSAQTVAKPQTQTAPKAISRPVSTAQPATTSRSNSSTISTASASSKAPRTRGKSLSGAKISSTPPMAQKNQSKATTASPR